MIEPWVTADTHFWHKNILKYQPNRGFTDVREMNQALIDRWNKLVSPDDVVYHLGDFGFCNVKQVHEILDQLNGEIHLIKGNHDRPMMHDSVQKRIVYEGAYFELKGFGKLPIIMSHYPFESWNRQAYGTIHMHGHSHCSGQNIGRRYDIGVDGNDCYPYHLPTLVDILNEEDVVNPFDHHTDKRKVG